MEHKPNHPVFVIGRRFGAGGRAIGKALAAKLGIPYFDKSLLEEAARNSGLSPEVFAHADEKRPSIFRQWITAAYGVADNSGYETFSGNSLYRAQSEVMRSLAQKGPCVFVGRSADYILRDFPGLVSVFIHASDGSRAERIVNRGDALDSAKALELAYRRDRDRENFYNYFTDRHWGHADNYHLSFDSSSMSAEDAADLIIAFSGKTKI